MRRLGLPLAAVVGLGCVRASGALPAEETAAPMVVAPELESVVEAEHRPEEPVEALGHLLGLTREAAPIVEFLGPGTIEESKWPDCCVYYLARDRGIELRFDDGGLSTLFLHGPGHEGFEGYAGPLPGGLEYGVSREQSYQHLGPPDEQGYVDRWQRAGWTLCLQYDHKLDTLIMVYLSKDD